MVGRGDRSRSPPTPAIGKKSWHLYEWRQHVRAVGRILPLPKAGALLQPRQAIPIGGRVIRPHPQSVAAVQVDEQVDESVEVAEQVEGIAEESGDDVAPASQGQVDESVEVAEQVEGIAEESGDGVAPASQGQVDESVEVAEQVEGIAEESDGEVVEVDPLEQEIEAQLEEWEAIFRDLRGSW